MDNAQASQELTAIAVWTTDPVSLSTRLEGIAPNMKTAKFHMGMILSEYANCFLEGMNYSPKPKHLRRIAALVSEEYRYVVNSIDYQVLHIGSVYTDIAFEVWFNEHTVDDLADVQAFYDAHMKEKTEWES